jgi:UDP-N-acetylmuramoylalanine--D-glutamate ligase
MVKLKGKHVVIAGLDKSGIGAVKYFTAQKAKITVVDLRNRLEVQKALSLIKDRDVKIEFGRYRTKTFLSADLIVKSMKLSHDDRVLKQARDKKIPIKTEYEFTSDIIKKPIVCITGTNGKSSTLALAHECLRHSGKKPFMSGHIGKSIYEFLLNEKEFDVLLLELDSEYFKYAENFKFDLLVLMNITDEKLIERSDSWQTFSDHVNLYKDFVTTVSNSKHVIYSRDCENVFTVISNLKANCLPFSMNFQSDDTYNYKHGSAFVEDGKLNLKLKTKTYEYSLDRIKLRGEFNKQNLMAAVCIAKRYGATDEAINFVVSSFAGIEHRLELVQKKNNVLFYNDARASTSKGLIRSLDSFERPVILIAGGKDRGEEFEELYPYIENKVKILILMGESKERMNRAVGDASETFIVGTFEEAVVLAYQKSQVNDIILYSPGCLPYDNFTKIEQRGRHYKDIIRTF